METPALVVNFKTYEQASGLSGLKLAEKCEKTARKTGKNIVITVQNADINRISSKVDIPVFAQHVDSESYGSHTGSDLASTLAFEGADGSLINHSEDPITIEEIEKDIERCLDTGLTSIVCVDSVELGKKVDKLNPDFIAYEPPELIGGDISVSESKPEVIEKMVKSVETPVMTGAGVKNTEDVVKSLELGTVGVLVASGVVKSENPEKVMENLVKPF